MAFTNLAVFGGAFFTPILVGKITHTEGWQWTFYYVGIFCFLSLIAIVLFCPETAFVRDRRFNLDMLSSDEAPAMPRHQDERSGDSKEEKRSTDPPPAYEAQTNGVAGTSSPPDSPGTPPVSPIPKNSWKSEMRLFNGRKTDEQFWKLLLRPLPMFLQPAFLWASLIQGTLIGWTVFIGVILAQFVIGTPLWWDEVNTGYAYTSAFIGALLGFFIAGLLADWSAKVMTRMNGGVYEPEFRIVLVIPQLILGCMGLYGWGITVDGMLKRQFHWAVPLTFFALEVAGMVIGAVASSLYIVDAYRGFYSRLSSAFYENGFANHTLRYRRACH